MIFTVGRLDAASRHCWAQIVAAAISSLALYLGSAGRILICCVFFGSTLAAAPPLKLSQWILDSWNMDSGLPHSTVTSIEQTRDGYLWLATRAGIARFDGIRSTLFDRSNIPGLGTNIVTTLVVDREGTLWGAPLEPGLVRFVGNRWERFGPETGLAKREIAQLHLNRAGRLWAAPTRGGLLEWNGAKFVPVRTPKPLPPSTILRVLHAVDGSTWLGSAEHGLIRWQGDTWEVYDKTSGLATNAIWAITETAQDTILVGGREGVDVLIGGKLRPSARPFALDKKIVTCALVMPGNEVWWGTYRNGVIRTAANATVDDAERVKAPEPLFEGEVRSLFQDREGSVWIGTQGGLHRLSSPQVVFYGEPEGLRRSSFGKIALSEKEGIVSVDTDGNVLDGEVGSQKIVATHPKKDVDQDLLGTSRDGTIWIRDSANLLFAVKSGQYRRQNIPTKEMAVSFLETASGEFWVGTRSGSLFRGNGVGVWENASPEFPIAKAPITLMAEDPSGAIYVGTRNGLAILQNRVWKTWNTSNGLPSNLISALYVDPNGPVWIGTAAGLVRLAGESLLVINKKNGLPDEAITGLALDPQGDLWAGSSSGVFRLRGRDLARLFHQPSIRLSVGIFTAKNGLRYPEGRPFTGTWVAKDGSIWMVMMRGLARIVPSAPAANPLRPETRIESILIDGQAASGRDGFVIPASTSRVEFQFTTLSLLRPERNRFRFRLVGYDRDWIDGATQRSAVYTGLKGGGYRFEVIGASSDHVESPSPATLSFEKSKAFTETIWFFLAIVSLIGCVTGLAGWLRIRHIQERHKAVMEERTRIARELHDTLLQGFTGVTLQLEAISKSNGTAHGSGERIRQVLGNADQYLREARQAVWDLRDQPRPSLAESLTATAGRLQGSIPVHCRVEGKPFPLVPAAERELLQIAQEAITNAQRHSGASNIAVNLEYSGATLALCVHDNGCGFDATVAPSPDTGHFGLAGMKERARRIGAKWETTSDPTGTRVSVTVRKA
ncbi:MAG: hypothetical protein K2X03_27275 [Bryobacteraceae bacterium]|nr:hypothetical protein [Bryobacteraceae bacterium]